MTYGANTHVCKHHICRPPKSDQVLKYVFEVVKGREK